MARRPFSDRARTGARRLLALPTTLLLLCGAALAQPPAWQTHDLIDVRTGETFCLADFAGRTVFVEGMAIWCGTCYYQLQALEAVKAELPAAGYAFVALNVDITTDPEQLARYADREGFGGYFAMADPDMLADLIETFGRTITKPGTHFVLRGDGTASELGTGFASREEVLEQLRDGPADGSAWQNSSMHLY